jgi:hypothetical protein
MILSLSEGALVSVDLDRQECLLQCREGRVWITMAGDSRDYFVKSGEDFLLSGKGKAVIQAVSHACIGIFGESSFTVGVNESPSPASELLINRFIAKVKELKLHSTPLRGVSLMYSESNRL